MLGTIEEKQIILEAGARDRVERMLRHVRRLAANPTVRKLTTAEKWRRLWRAIVGLFE